MLSLLRHGFVSLRRAPTLALTIIATLGVALAAAVLVFSFLNTFLLRPLPFGDASRLVVVYEYSLKGGRDNFTRFTYGNMLDVQERARSFARTGFFRNESVTVHGGDTTEVAFVQRVTPDVFPMMSARAALGSVISRANAEIDGIHAVVLSEALWRRRFGADPAIVGRVVRLDQQNYHVVGVMAADFRVPTSDDNPQAWLSLLPSDYLRNERTQRRHHFWAELAPGQTIAAAESELAAIAATLRQEHPRENANRSFLLVPLRDDLLGGFGRNLVLLQGAVLLVLVVACFNCLCLLIARAIQRRREFAVRLALGAARRHLLAQLFAESLWLAVPAALLALALASVALPSGASLLAAAGNPALDSLPAPQIDAVVAGTVLGVAILVAAAFSAVPLLQTRRLNLESALREGGRSAGSPTGARAARWLASAQIAVALALLICAALLLRSQRNLARVDYGFPIAEYDQFRVGLRGDTYNDPTQRLQFFERVRDNLRALPGVRDATAATFLFSEPPKFYSAFVQEGDGVQLNESPKRALVRSVLPDLFATMNLRLAEGRFLQETDVPGRPLAAVISASVAAKYWPGESALGKRVRTEGAGDTEWAEIVGVVSNVLGLGNQPRSLDVIYFTLAQRPPPPALGASLLVRHRGFAPDERALQRAIWQVDPNMQFFGHVSPAEIYARGAWQSRFVSELVAAFALLAVALAIAGICAVNSFLVARRVSEFGIRAALGATQFNLLALVVRDSLRLTLAGLAAGVLVALAAAQGLVALLYGVSAVDGLVYVTAATLMTAACVTATLLPGRRAARVDPLIALRAE